MAKSKTLKCVNMVRINGEFVNQEDMTQEEFSKIMSELGNRMMKAAGFVPKEKKGEENETQMESSDGSSSNFPATSGS